VPSYQTFPDSERGDSFEIPKAYYAPNEVEHVSSDGSPVPSQQVLLSKRFEIELARHHIISWKIIRECWNKCVKSLDGICTELVRLLSESRSVEQPDADKLCWAKPNLIIGPLGNHRMFDPGDEIDFESPIGIKGARQLHIAAMVELGKLLKAYTADQIESKEFQRRFHIMLEACKRQTGDDICIFVREEWTLNMKPIVKWKKSFTGDYETDGKPSPPLWHRGSYSPSTVAKFWEPGVSREGMYKNTAKLRQHNHTRFIESIGNDITKAKWRFLTT
jgi:hypothetical protein